MYRLIRHIRGTYLLDISEVQTYKTYPMYRLIRHIRGTDLLDISEVQTY